MSHAITLGGLLATLGIVVGLAAAAVGLLMIFAGGMSDAPQAGDAAGKQGCITFIVGLAILAWSLLALLS